MSDKNTAVRIFNDLAILLELQGVNPFKIKAYTNAARELQQHEGELSEWIASGAISEMKGIGKSLADKLTELVQTGKIAEYEELRTSFPEGLIALLRIPGLGAKKVRVLYEQLGISNIEALEQACQQNQLLTLPGFGQKTQEKILQGIAQVRQYQGRFRLNQALPFAQQLLADLRAIPAVLCAELGGSLRRWKETVKDIDFVVATDDSESVMNAFVKHPLAAHIIAHGPTKSSITLHNGLNVDLRTVTLQQYPYALMHFTGSKEHNTTMRKRAKDRGLKLNEYGLFREDELVLCDSESAIFAALDLHYIPPELREDRTEFTWAEVAESPLLVDVAQIKGIFHAHSTYSDGNASLREMAEACRNKGFQYLGITDHSRSAYYAGGLSIEAVLQQHVEIETLNHEWHDFQLFKGIESDILVDGRLDYPEDILSLFDFVIVSVHSQFKMTQDEMTARIIRAIENPYTTMLGHPTGRLLLNRDAYPVDMHKVIDAAVANQVVIEINANPYRLDIDWRLLEYARNKGMMVSINPDAHAVAGLDDIQYGVGIARKGGLSAEHVLNTLDLEQIRVKLRTMRPKP